jgi:hypothetical protein
MPPGSTVDVDRAPEGDEREVTIHIREGKAREPVGVGAQGAEAEEGGGDGGPEQSGGGHDLPDDPEVLPDVPDAPPADDDAADSDPR